MNTNKLFYVEHSFDYDDDGRTIGLFSTIKKAKEAITFLKDKPGFCDYPVECFEIRKAQIDIIYWNGGFVSWDEASETD
jgi:hypothetical protein